MSIEYPDGIALNAASIRDRIDELQDMAIDSPDIAPFSLDTLDAIIDLPDDELAVAIMQSLSDEFWHAFDAARDNALRLLAAQVQSQ